MLKARHVILAIGICVGAAAYGQPYRPVHATKQLPGWQCMSLASVFGPQGAYAPPVPVYSGPQPKAPQVGTGAGVLIVPKPLHLTNDRTEVLWSNGERVWINADELAPWHSLSDPKAVCHPALLSNGRYGFVTSN